MNKSGLFNVPWILISRWEAIAAFTISDVILGLLFKAINPMVPGLGGSTIMKDVEYNIAFLSKLYIAKLSDEQIFPGWGDNFSFDPEGRKRDDAAVAAATAKSQLASTTPGQSLANG